MGDKEAGGGGLQTITEGGGDSHALVVLVDIQTVQIPCVAVYVPKAHGAAALYRHEGVVDLKRPVPCPQVDVLWRPCVQLLFCVVSSVDGVDRLIEQRCQWDRVERLVGSDHHAPPPSLFWMFFYSTTFDALGQLGLWVARWAFFLL